MARLCSVPRPPPAPDARDDISDSDDDLPPLENLIEKSKQSSKQQAVKNTASEPRSSKTPGPRSKPANSSPPQDSPVNDAKWPSLTDLQDALSECSSLSLPPLVRSPLYTDSPDRNSDLSSSPPPIFPRRPLRRLVRGSERKHRSSCSSEVGAEFDDDVPRRPISRSKAPTKIVAIEISSDSESDVAPPTKVVTKNTTGRITAPALLPRNPYLCDSASEETESEEEDSDLDGFVVSDEEVEQPVHPPRNPFRKSLGQNSPVAIHKKQYVYNGSSEEEDEDTDLSGFIVNDDEEISFHNSSDELPSESDDEDFLPSPPRKLPSVTKGKVKVDGIPQVREQHDTSLPERKPSSIWDLPSSSPQTLLRTPGKPSILTRDIPLRNTVKTPATSRHTNKILLSSSPVSSRLEDTYDFSSSPPSKMPPTLPPKTPSRSPTKRAPLTSDQILAKTLREFKKNRVQLAETFLAELDKRVCDGALSRLYASTGGIQLIWSKTLITTAGRAKHRGRFGGTGQSGSIELGEKMIDRPDRLYETLAHEFCHLTTMGLDGDLNDYHGPRFKIWGRKTEAAFPEYELDIKTTHDYTAEKKYHWTCEGCGYVYQRHSKSIRPEKQRCGPCKGRLVQTKPKPREIGTYAKFVQENLASVRKTNPNTPHKELMRLVGVQWAEKKRVEADVASPVKVVNVKKRSEVVEIPDSEDELDMVMSKLKV